MTDLFAEDGNLVGFDGSQINGRSEARSVLSQIFADHQTAAYLGIVKEVRVLSPDVAHPSRRRRHGTARTVGY